MVRLDGKVCVVTGASRGIGRGIALQLAKAGATVYITGRTLQKTIGVVGSLEETSAEISACGQGKCIPIQCDHSKDSDIERLFHRIKTDQNGRLDVLVNNAYSAVMKVTEYLNVPFWQQPISMWDDSNNIGLRNHYVCSVYASQLMVPHRQGLIVNISSMGGLKYAYNVAYGIGKAALDRMAADCAKELRGHNVACVSLWPGAVLTELMDEYTKDTSDRTGLKGLFKNRTNCETPEFTGIAITHLAADPSIMKKSGHVLLTGDLSDEYEFVDINGRKPVSFRSFGFMLDYSQHPTLANLFPRWMKVPRWVLNMAAGKL